MFEILHIRRCFSIIFYIVHLCRQSSSSRGHRQCLHLVRLLWLWTAVVVELLRRFQSAPRHAPLCEAMVKKHTFIVVSNIRFFHRIFFFTLKNVSCFYLVKMSPHPTFLLLWAPPTVPLWFLTRVCRWRPAQRPRTIWTPALCPCLKPRQSDRRKYQWGDGTWREKKKDCIFEL